MKLCINFPPSGGTVSQTFQAAGNFDIDIGVASLHAQLVQDGVPVGDPVGADLSDASPWAWRASFDGVAPGTYALTATQFDAAGGFLGSTTNNDIVVAAAP